MNMVYHSKSNLNKFNYVTAIYDIDKFIKILNKTTTVQVLNYFTNHVLQNGKKINKNQVFKYIHIFAKTINLILNCTLSVRLVLRSRQLNIENQINYYKSVYRVDSDNINLINFNPYTLNSHSLYYEYYAKLKYIFYYFKERRIDSNIRFDDISIFEDLVKELNNDYKYIYNFINKILGELNN
jgi:hypothetical protein